MATTLTNREVTRRYVTLEEPKLFDDVWAELRNEFPDTDDKALLPVRDVKQRLNQVLLGNEAGENTFHHGLFEALRECCGSYVLNKDDLNDEDEYECDDERQTNNKNFIVLEQIGDYAIGFARGVDCTYGLVPNSAKETSSGLRAGCKLDHGSCLLVKQGKRWRATDIFSVVEIKTSDGNEGHGMDLESTHGAMGQAILYTLGGVLLYHARNGVLSGAKEQLDDVATTEETQGKDPTKTSLPWAVVALPSDKSKKLRWVYGDLLIPKACGHKFEYCVQGSGNVSGVANVEDEESVAGALSAYVDTLLFGIRTARRVLRDRVGKPYRPDPMTGMKLMIGEQHLKFSILASPKPDHAAIGPNQGDQEMVVSQAELFIGNLNVHETLTKSGLGRASYVQFDTTKLEVPVLIKVSSRAVHRPLINPSIAFATMKVAHEVLDSRRLQGRRVLDPTAKRPRKNAPAVAGPLLAAVQTSVGVITIMTDLSKEGYKLLKPRDYSKGLAPLWKGFKDLVAGVLLPLAHQDYSVVHSDIRAGFDVTTNILFKQVNGERVRMELIDFESLVSLDNWAAPETHGGYIQKVDGWVATTFVWWQCMFVAFAWLEERNVVRTKERRTNLAVASAAHDRNAADMNLLLGRIPERQWLPPSLRKYAAELNIDAKSVLATLAELDDIFF